MCEERTRGTRTGRRAAELVGVASLPAPRASQGKLAGGPCRGGLSPLDASRADRLAGSRSSTSVIVGRGVRRFPPAIVPRASTPFSDTLRLDERPHFEATVRACPASSCLAA